MEKIIYKKSFVSAKTNLPLFSAKKALAANQSTISIIQSKHVRNKTEPKIVLSNETATKPISQYFEESLELLNAIHYYLDLSAENNNKPLLSSKKKKKSKNKIKLSSEKKKHISNEIVTSSNKRKETYRHLFDSIDQSLDTIKKNLVEKVELVNESDEEEISNIIKLSTIKDDKENCNASESVINELESQNTITNDDDSVDEEHSVNKFPNMILSKNIMNPSLKNLNTKYTNVSTNMTTQNETKPENNNNKICLIF